MSKKRKALRNRYEKQIWETDKNKQRSLKKIVILSVIYLIWRKCAFKDVISNNHTDLLIIGPSRTLKWTNPVLFRISEPYFVSCKIFFSFDPIFLYLKLVKKGVIFAWCGQFVKNFPFSPEIIFFYGSGLLPWES